VGRICVAIGYTYICKETGKVVTGRRPIRKQSNRWVHVVKERTSTRFFFSPTPRKLRNTGATRNMFFSVSMN
jgi:hypothetical protein